MQGIINSLINRTHSKKENIREIKVINRREKNLEVGKVITNRRSNPRYRIAEIRTRSKTRVCPLLIIIETLLKTLFNRISIIEIFNNSNNNKI